MTSAAIAQAKIDLLNKNAVANAQDFISRRASAPAVVLSDQTNDLKERLRLIMEQKQEEEENANQIIDRMKSLRGDLHKTLDSCHKTLEVSSVCLADHFKSIPAKKLLAEIKDRFEHFDRDHSGSLDKDEVREAMAEMGTRPSEDELDEFYKQCDLDGNGFIDLVEFEHMVRVKLGLLDTDALKNTVASTKEKNARVARRASMSATQDVALMRAAAESSRFGRRASLPGSIESIPELSATSPTGSAAKNSPPKASVAAPKASGIGRTASSATKLPAVSRTTSSERPAREATRPGRTASAAKSPEPAARRGSAASKASTASPPVSRTSSASSPSASKLAPKPATKTTGSPPSRLPSKPTPTKAA